MPKKIFIFEIPRVSIQKSVSYWETCRKGKVRDYDKLLALREELLSDPYNCETITSQVRETIKNALIDWDLSLNNSTERFLSELVSNAYDSFNTLDGNPEENLVLKIVIKEKTGNLWIKIMDNGAGFQNQAKGNYFSRKDVVPEIKDPAKHIGGSKIGLDSLERSLKEMNGILFFKNRKEQGASVYLQIPAPGLSKQRCILQ
jgi:K+-sensing histidine kinase KdpD